MLARLVQSIFLVFALSAVALLLLAAGSGCDRRSMGAMADRSPARIIRIGYFANVTHAQAVLGVASGDFSRAVAPARLDSRVFTAGPALVEALLAGQIDIGYVGPGPVINACRATQGQGIRVVAGSAANGVLIVARAGSGICGLADLAGRRIATPQEGNTQDLAARHYLLSVLKQSNAANVIAIANPEQAAMLARGQIDAAWVPEPWGSRLIDDAHATRIAQEKDLWPGGRFAMTVVVASPDFLAQHWNLAQKFLRVHADWTARLARDPQAYASQLDDALAAISGRRLKAPIIRQALEHVEFTLDPLTPTFETLARWTCEMGLSRSPADLSRLFDSHGCPNR